MKIKLTKYAAILFIVQSLAWALMSLLCILCRGNVIERHDANGESFKNDLEDLFYIMFMEEHNTFTDMALNPDAFLVFCSLILTESVVWCILSACILFVKATPNHCFFKLKLSWCIVGILVAAIDVSFTVMVAQDLRYYSDIYANNPSIIVYYMVVYGILLTIAARGFILLIMNIAIHVLILKQIFSDLNVTKFNE